MTTSLLRLKVIDPTTKVHQIKARNVFTGPQRSCEGYVFTGVCLSTGGVVVSQHALQQVCGGCLLLRGCLLLGGLVETPPSGRRLLLRTVRILLECILVKFIF